MTLALLARRMLAVSAIAPALVLSACGSDQPDPVEVLAKTEAAAVRAEQAQKAAEKAAEVAQGNYRRIAQAEASAAEPAPEPEQQQSEGAPSESGPNSNHLESGTPSQ